VNQQRNQPIRVINYFTKLHCNWSKENQLLHSISEVERKGNLLELSSARNHASPYITLLTTPSFAM
jgi:hypothetical protein